MAFPTIDYNSSTGSDTNPSDCIASNVTTGGVTVSGTASTTTINFSSNVNLSGVDDDDSDYIWVEGTSGQRHLFRILAFLGSTSSCSGVTVAQQIGASGLSASAWHVNGTRRTLASDLSNPGPNDWMPGWTIRLDGTFAFPRAYTPGSNSGAGTNARAIYVIPHPSATSRPIIDTQTTNINYIIYCATTHKNIAFKCTTGGGANTGVRIGNASHGFENCTFDFPTCTSAPVQDNGNPSGSSLIGCLILGSSTNAYGLYLTTASRYGLAAIGCTFDGQGSGFTTAALSCDGQQGQINISDCLFHDLAGDGVRIDGGSTSSPFLFWINNCTFDNIGGNGVAVVGTVGTYNAAVVVMNCIFKDCGAWAITDQMTSSIIHWWCNYNAFYSNTSGNYNTAAYEFLKPGPNDIGTLSGDPFTNAAADDYSLDNVAGEGAACRGKAFPQVPPKLV